jgi:hypothetical protein
MKKANLQVLIVAVLVIIFGSVSLSLAKSHGGSPRDPYEWEPKTSSENIIECIRVGYDEKLWEHSIYRIGIELEKGKEISPEVLEKLSSYSQYILDRLSKSQDINELEQLSKALILFKEKGVKNLPDIQKATHQQYVIIGKKLLEMLSEICKGKNRDDTKFTLRNIDAVLRAGVSLQEIDVSSVEKMRDLAYCR